MRMNLRDRKIRVRGYSISALLLTALIVSAGIVLAVAYVTLEFTSTASVIANPDVCFVKWSDNSKQNTFDYAVNIFPSVKTVDENITHGIWNWDASSHAVNLRIKSITTSSNIANVTTVVKNGTETVVTASWVTAGGLPTTWQPFTALASTKYTLWTEITATSGASGSSTITYELKVENP